MAKLLARLFEPVNGRKTEIGVVLGVLMFLADRMGWLPTGMDEESKTAIYALIAGWTGIAFKHAIKKSGPQGGDPPVYAKDGTRLMSLILLAFVLVAQPALVRAGAEGIIQDTLLKKGHFEIPPNTTYYTDDVIRVGARQTIEGHGFGSQIILRNTSAGPWAVIVGVETQTIYGTHLKNFVVSGGGVLVKRTGQSSSFTNVWVFSAPAEGWLINGPGDRARFDMCGANECGVGFRISTTGSQNGLILAGCHAAGNGGSGLIVETAINFPAYLADLRVTDFTCQGNCRSSPGDAEIVLAGTLTEPRFEHLYVEGVQAGTGIRIEGRTFPLPGTNKNPRAPYGVWFGDGTRVESHNPKFLAMVVKGAEGNVKLSDTRFFKPSENWTKVPVLQSGNVSNEVRNMIPP